MPPAPYFPLAVAILALSFSVPGALAQGNGDEAHMQACVVALSTALSNRLSAADYPKELQGNGTQGTVQVRLTIAHDGRLRETSVGQSSSNAALDRAALKAVDRVFPRGSAAPSECRLDAESLVTLPIRFEVHIERHN
jgi:TonB family protein